MSVNRQYIDSFNDVSDNGLFQLSGETSCLFKTSIWQATKTSMLPTALDFPKEIIINLVWHWKSKVFPKGCSQHDLKAFR